MANDKRESIKNRIRALMNVTVENGATENEAMIAADKAAKLMREYNLSHSEIEFGEIEFGQIRIPHRGADLKARTGGNYGRADYCIATIAEYCNVKGWVSTETGKNRIMFINFFGDEISCKMAEFLYKLIDGAIDREGNIFKTNPIYKTSNNKKGAMVSFQKGMVSRICYRLAQLNKSTNANNNKTENALIVLKNQLVEEKFKEQFVLNEPMQKKFAIGNSAAFVSGTRAANNVNLNRPIENTSKAEEMKLLA